MNILAAELREAAGKSDGVEELAVAFVATADTDVCDHDCSRCYIYILYNA